MEENRKSLIAGINSLAPLNQENMWEDLKEKNYTTTKDVVGVNKRKYQEWFDDNDEEFGHLLKEKQQLHEKTLLPNLSADEREKNMENV